MFKYLNVTMFRLIAFIWTKSLNSYNYNYSDMATTIQVSDTTKQMLDMLKEKKQIKTHDKLIQYLIEEEVAVPKSMFGAMKGLKKWSKEDRFDFHEL